MKKHIKMTFTVEKELKKRFVDVVFDRGFKVKKVLESLMRKWIIDNDRGN